MTDRRPAPRAAPHDEAAGRDRPQEEDAGIRASEFAARVVHRDDLVHPEDWLKPWLVVFPTGVVALYDTEQEAEEGARLAGL